MRENRAWSWERQAYDNEPVPEGLSALDQLAYIAMRCIYCALRAGAPKDRLAAEKQAVLQIYNAAAERKAFEDRLTAYHVRVTRETERAASACRKDPTPENAVRLCNVLVGIDLPVEEAPPQANPSAVG